MSDGDSNSNTVSATEKEEAKIEKEEPESADAIYTNEDRKRWMNVLQIPFEPTWEYLLMLLAVVNLILLMHHFVTVGVKNELTEGHKVFNRFTDILFLCDDFLMVVCRWFHGLRIPYLCIKRPIWLLILDAISTIPAVELFVHLTREVNVMFEFIDFLKCVRILYYFDYHSRMINHKALNVAIIYFIVSTFALFVLIFCSFQILNCIIGKHCDIMSTTYDVCHSATILSFRGVAGEQGTSYFLALATAFALLAWLFVSLRRIALLITGFVNDTIYEYTFRGRLHYLQQLMNGLDISPALRRKATDFFLLDWNRRAEYHKDEVKRCIQLLPNTLQLELHSEIYWPALFHSQMFREMDLPLLRYVAQKMHKIVMYPGEIVHLEGTSRDRMIFVVSGVVQILSEKDGETPILSFSSGTSLGGSTLFISYPSKVTVRCRDYGELHMLKMADLVQMTKKFPKQYAKLRNTISARYVRAKKLCKIRDVLDEKYGLERKTKDLTIMWLSSTLHRLMMKSGVEGQSHECQNIYLREELEQEPFDLRYFTGNFLNLLAITERVSLLRDSIFVKRQCPPVFQPDSGMMFLWHIFICFLALLNSAVIPFYAALASEIPQWYWLLIYATTFYYCLDIYIIATTAVQQYTEMIDDIPAIIQYNLGRFKFWVDIVAALPLEIVTSVIFENDTLDDFVLIHLNRIAKLISVMSLIYKFERHNPSRAVLIKALKNLIPFFYITYFLSCTLFRSEEDILSLDLSHLIIYIKYGIQMASTTGLEQVDLLVVKTYWKYSIVVFISFYIYVTTVSKYAAERITAEYVKHKFQNAYFRLRAAAVVFGVDSVLQYKVKKYISTQWHYDRALQFMDSTRVLKNLPVKVHELLLEDAAAKVMEDVPIFKQLPEDVLFHLCAAAHFEMLPPQQVICYSGSMQDFFHHIIEGQMMVVNTATSQKVQMIDANTTILAADVCLNIPVVNTYITSTHCKILTFSLPLVRSILLKHSQGVDISEKNELFEDIKSKMIALKKSSRYVDESDSDRAKKRCSFRHFGYNLRFDSPEEYEYYVPFDRCKYFSFVRIFLLRTTIMPSGNFLIFWEITRSILAILSGMLFVINPLVTNWKSQWIYVLAFLDVMAWVDIYVRLHVCYYDTNGILITHPLKTATHYLTHAFYLDAAAAFPFGVFFSPRTAKVNKIYTFVHSFRLLQVYRYWGLIKFIERPYSPRFKTVAILKYIPLLLVFNNFLASLVCNYNCDFHEDIRNELFEDGVECHSESFLVRSEYRKPLTKHAVCQICFMVVIRYLTCAGAAIVDSSSQHDAVISVGLIIIGFILHISLFACLISRFSVERSTLMRYKHAFDALKSFLRSERVGTAIRCQLIEHYELKWERTRGEDLMKRSKKLCKSLREDIVHFAFGRELEQHSVFADKSKRHFFRMMLLDAEHETVTAKSTICFVNQVISKLYILYKGTVEVVAPDGSKLTVLEKGSLFGNLDDYSRVRQTVSIKATSHCEVLTIEALRFHALLKRFPQLQKQFRYLTLFHIDYLHGKTMDELRNVESADDQVKRKSFISKVWNLFLLVVVCFFATALQIYMQFLIEYCFSFVMFLYVCDVFYVVHLLIKFCTAYKNEVQPFRKVFRKHFSYLALITCFPADIPWWFLSLDSGSRYKGIFWLRANRILRMLYVFEYFDQFEHNIKVATNSLKILKLVVVISTILHIMTCVLVSVACTDPPNFEKQINCKPLEHINHKHKEKLLLYVEHSYVAISFFLRGTQYHYFPTTARMFIYYNVAMLVSAFAFTAVSAYLISILRGGAFIKIAYACYCRSLRNYMKSENVSEATVDRVWRYLACIWKEHQGPVIPELLESAPITLKMRVIRCCFAHHLVNHPIFKRCHEDFLGQLMVTIKMYRFFPGDFIAFKGDIGGCMYFIHKGKVEVLAGDIDSEATFLCTLVQGQSFAVLQGLYTDKPFDYYFRSANKTLLLVLEKDAWAYLLDYYPASKEVIYSAANSYSSF